MLQCVNNLQIIEPSAPFPIPLLPRKHQPWMKAQSEWLGVVMFLNNLFDLL